MTLFRFDPPALVISVVWHMTRHPFIETFRSHLEGRYTGNEKSVCIPIYVSKSTEVITSSQLVFINRNLRYSSEDNDKHLGPDAAAKAVEFLEARPYAKIVILIDTHAADNGYFVWSEDTTGDYKACSLLEVGVAIGQCVSRSH